MTSVIGKKRILALSQDHGSVQAIVPVVAALQDCPQVVVKLLLPAGCYALLRSWDLVFDTFDKGMFAADSEAYVAKVFDRVEPQLLLSGASPAKGRAPETLEQFAILEARRRCIPSVAVLDYWGMYLERFSSCGSFVDDKLLPDKLCVLDRCCRDDLLQLGVPGEIMVMTHNPWIDGVVGQVFDLPSPSGLLSNADWCVLFVSQPLSRWQLPNKQYLQHELLSDLVRALPPKERRRHRILVWKHPVEDESRWADIDRFSTNDADVLLSNERGAAILAYVDMVATVHSTIAYEALHYGTPTLSLRSGVENIPASIINVLGLSKIIKSVQELKSFLALADLNVLRIQLLAQKRLLCKEGVFFSDGMATCRVMAEVLQLLNISVQSQKV